MATKSGAKRLVVTGGSGYLGGRLVENLLGKGFSVDVVSRSRGHDIRRAETLGSVFEGADAVFHLAALVQSRPGPFDATNIDGLRNVLEACEKGGVGRLVCVSSFTIFGPSAGVAHNETSVAKRSDFFHGYDRTKYEGYRLAEQWRGRIPLNLAFPTVIFGPGAITEGNITAHLFRRWLRLRVAALPGRGQPSWNFVHVEDVAEGLSRVLEAPPGEDFILGGENCRLRRLSQMFAHVADKRILAVGLPDALFRASALFEDVASRIGRFPPLALPSTAGFFLADWEFSSDKARLRLEYRPRSLEKGLQDTYRWMQQTGLP